MVVSGASSDDAFKLRHPIVLIHGLGARQNIGPLRYFSHLPELLAKAGTEVLLADIHPWHSLETRTEELKAQINARFPDGKVNLLGHSMGGLDARHVVAKGGFAERVASVTSVGSPHRGTSVGDFVLKTLPETARLAIEELINVFGLSNQGLQQMTREHVMNTLAPELGDAAGVAYFSATTVIRNPAFRNSLPVFWLPHRLIHAIEGENDGFVSEESAKWGEHIVTDYGDHYAQIGYEYALNRSFDFEGFYSKIFRRLRAEGF
jgi:triacylglycerol lipase